MPIVAVLISAETCCKLQFKEGKPFC